MRTSTVLLALLISTCLASCTGGWPDPETSRLAPRSYLEKLTFEQFTVVDTADGWFTVSGLIGNHGEETVSQVKLAISFVDPDGLLLGSSRHSVETLILPGQCYRFHQYWRIPETFGRPVELADATVDVGVFQVWTKDTPLEPVK